MKPLAELSDEALAHLAARSVRELPDAPSWLVESAIAMWRAPTPAPQPSPGLGQRIAAVLGFDSWAVQPMPALRSATPGARQWLFSAGEHDIDLRAMPVEGAPGMYRLSGQLLGPGDDLVVTLSQGGTSSAETRPDEFGEFHLGPLSAGRYALMLQVAGRQIELPKVEIGGEAPP